MHCKNFFLYLVLSALLIGPTSVHSATPTYFSVYGVYTALNMGNPDETSKKDYYVNMGSNHGVQIGTLFTVFRTIATYDTANRKLQKDLTYPVGTLKVIHVEDGASVARLEKLLTDDQSPILTPRAILVGDSVQLNR